MSELQHDAAFQDSAEDIFYDRVRVSDDDLVFVHRIPSHLSIVRESVCLIGHGLSAPVAYTLFIYPDNTNWSENDRLYEVETILIQSYVEYVFIALSVEYTLPALEMKQLGVMPSTIVVVNYGVDTICCISGLYIRVTDLLCVSLGVDMFFISWNGLKRRSQSEGLNLLSLLICLWSAINLFGLDETMESVIFVPVHISFYLFVQKSTVIVRVFEVSTANYNNGLGFWGTQWVGCWVCMIAMRSNLSFIYGGSFWRRHLLFDKADPKIGPIEW